jgi:hypothetical protein
MNFFQITKQGCGLYSLDNLFNCGEFITVENICSIDENNGQYIGQLNQYLAKIFPQYYIVSLYDNFLASKVPKANWKILASALEDNQVFPFLLRIKKGRKEHHLVSGIINQDGLITIYDSLLKKASNYDRDTINQLKPNALYLINSTDTCNSIVFYKN